MEQLLVAIEDNVAFVQAIERGTFKLSASLKEFGNAAIGRDVKRIVFDMSRCVGMDSTFMGVIAGLALRIKQKNAGQIFMVELTNRTRGLLSTLGLDHLVRPFMEGEMPQEYRQILVKSSSTLSDIAVTSHTQAEQAEVMLEAHENLIEVSSDNLPRFKDVVIFLREDVNKLREEEESKITETIANPEPEK